MIKKYKKFILTIFVVAILAIAVANAGSVLAQFRLNVDYPPVPTPGGLFDLDEEIKAGNVTFSAIIVFIYSAGIWIAGILALLALILAGLAYIVSGTNPGRRKQAMEKFTNVIWGLVILLLVGVILSIINTEITTIKDPTLRYVTEGDNQFLGFNFNFNTETSGPLITCDIRKSDPYPSCASATTPDCEGKCTGDSVLNDPDSPTPDTDLYYFCSTLEAIDASSIWYGGECSGLGGDPDPNFITTLSSACNRGTIDSSICPDDTYSVSDNGANQVYCTTNSNPTCGNPFGLECLGYDGDMKNDDVSITQKQDSSTSNWTYTCLLK